MQRYMYEYKVPHSDFAPFPINAHHNAMNNPYAMMHYELTQAMFDKARMIADPINLLDCSPVCDGSAAIVLCPTEIARQFSPYPIRVRASAIATDSLALHDRHNLLALEAVGLSARKAFDQARLTPKDVDFFEVHDAFSITAVVSLEASGFAEPGKGTRLGLDGDIFPGGKLPICTMGGLKARGHPVGATGMYQLVEASLQLRGLAGLNQVKDATIAMIQNIGGSGSNVVTHILERNE
jgi:acetyl-CoA C-acetyltransferase